MEAESTRHLHHCGSLRRCVFVNLRREEHEGRGEHDSPLHRRLAFAQRLAVEIRHLDIAKQVHLHDEIVFFQQRDDFRADQHLSVHLGAIDTAALFPDQQQPLALGVRLCQILAQILERVAHPGSLVQPVIAQFGGTGRGCQHQGRNQGREKNRQKSHRILLLQPTDDRPGNHSIMNCAIRLTPFVAINTANRINIAPIAFST